MYIYIYIYILICTYTKPFIIRHMFRMSCFYTSLAFASRSESGRFEQMWGCEATFENVASMQLFPFDNSYFYTNDPKVIHRQWCLFSFFIL